MKGRSPGSVTLICLSALSVLVLVGCGPPAVHGSGVSKTEAREIEPCSKVKFVGGGKVEITVGEGPSLQITGDDNLLPLILTEVRGTTLLVKPKQKIKPKAGLVVEVTLPEIRSVELEGAAVIDVQGVDSEEMALAVTGAGAVTASGQTKKLRIVLTGATAAQAGELMADDVSVTIAGAGTASVHANTKLTVAIAGAGSVRYSGDPKVTQEISGAGTVAPK